MNTSNLARLASIVGLSVDWTDAHGHLQTVSDQALRKLLAALGYPAESETDINASLERATEERDQALTGPLIITVAGDPCPLGDRFHRFSRCQITTEQGECIDTKLDYRACLVEPLPIGYHQLQIADHHLTLAVTPPHCQSVDSLAGEPHSRLWGLSAQLYSLRRENDGGVGDTLALQHLASRAAVYGADALAISPVHAMFTGLAEQYSPYSPSNRSLFNALHSAPEQVLGRAAVEQATRDCNLEEQMALLESRPLVDWAGVSEARLRLLRRLYDNLVAEQSELLVNFHSFCAEGGSALHQHACFEALHAHLHDEQGTQDWRQWPAAYRDPASETVRRFAREHEDEIGFHLFCQWLMARCLEQTQNASRAAGMRIGLITDLAVGADPRGSMAWSRQGELLRSVTVGAPPDILNTQGQNWGVAAFSPQGLQRHGYTAFIEMLQANLAHAGGVRIDHVMGLQRLWVIPEGASPAEGAYLNYPFADLMRLLALESWRNQALIIGEDLGTVSGGLREALAKNNLLGMRVLLFEQTEGGDFILPNQWPTNALATTTTHDLPTINGWFQGNDISWRHRLGQRSDSEARTDMQHRNCERNALSKALKIAGHCTADITSPENQLEACIGFIGCSPAPLVMLPLEDAMGIGEQPNLPGPPGGHPNWRRRWSESAEHMLDIPTVQRRLRRLALSRQASRTKASAGVDLRPAPAAQE
ncbi:4-alpha-glucanotransferase [Halopseudomonas sabulinigri]|uniref:4-alpha-glucanotransferase n=1 Tax=Halopseudomonas sabulinigri TaxID=472181 RepID=A0A1H1PBS6_9GAMM|nr:4-alpha-glucanotransferase [Halopseudomonas sabulinigri]SDS08574.1 4-alpha-glucanotransferase [Halopseudomonas sabulinigri]